MKILQKGDSKLLNAWAFYDWANSVYSLVITSAIFPIFYGALFQIKGSQYIDIGNFHFKSTALISFVTAFAFVIVAVTSPILSGISDYLGNKKRFMQFYCFLGSTSCIALYWFSLDHIILSLTFYFLGLIGFWGSIVFYNSYLPDIAFKEQQDQISAKGYSLGYIGSVLLLLLNLAMVMEPSIFGISGAKGEASIKAMRYSFVMVGIWWIVFSQYSFYFLPIGIKTTHKISSKFVFKGLKELRLVWNSFEENKPLKKYLKGFFVYSMAVQTVMLSATFFGEQEIAWKSESEKTTGLIISILLIQLIAVFGAILTAKASEKFGNIPTLIILNAIWVLVCLIAYFIQLPIHFYSLAVLVGLIMGGIQSLSRSTYSKYIPNTTDTASYFSFYDVAEKIGIVIGMCIYGVIDQISGSPRNAIVFLGLFFVLGILLLRKVKSKPILEI